MTFKMLSTTLRKRRAIKRTQKLEPSKLRGWLGVDGRRER
jgi:hypothetical protein